MNSPSNILFVTADQWRGDCLSTLQHPCVRTPHLDDLAASGVLFAEHYCQAVPCGPSRASLHTGLYMMNHRSVTNGTPLDRRHSNWALKLRAAGERPEALMLSNAERQTPIRGQSFSSTVTGQ